MRLSYAYLLTAASLLAGIGLSCLEGNWQWLSRSGSLIVVIGILLTSTQIVDELYLMRQRRLRSEHNQDSWSSHDWATEAESHKKLRHGEEEFTGRGQGLYLLVAGTLLWGFGDLVGRFF